MFPDMEGGGTHIRPSFWSSHPLSISWRNSMHIEHNISLSNFTTLHIGGPAAFFVSVTTIEGLREALVFAQEKSHPTCILGGGSNILVSDSGFNGLVIKMEIKGVRYRDVGGGRVEVEAGAGESWDDLVSFAVAQGLYGIENLSGIPGTVGATPIQNIGAYGTELNDVLKWVDVIDSATLTTKRLSADACQLEYRDSIFKHPRGKKYIITSVCLMLCRVGEPNLLYHDLKQYFEKVESVPTLQEIRDAVLAIRAQKFPDLTKVGTAGSFFKNPIVSVAQYRELLQRFPRLPAYYYDIGYVKISLGGILESLGWKGKVRGSIATYERQALVLVAQPGTTCDEVDTFAQEIEQDVKEKTGIAIDREVVHVVK